MNGLILNFSPRKSGNSNYIANLVFKKFKSRFNSLDILSVYNLKISKCGNCQSFCYRYGICKIKDDMQILYRHFENDNVFFFITPVYFYHIPGYAKVMIDRCQPYWVRKYILKNLFLGEKKGFLVCLGATKGKKLFDIFNIKFDKNQNLYLRNTENIKDLKQNNKILKNFFDLLKRSFVL